jgi:hypothetical protein
VQRRLKAVNNQSAEIDVKATQVAHCRFAGGADCLRQRRHTPGPPRGSGVVSIDGARLRAEAEAAL